MRFFVFPYPIGFSGVSGAAGVSSAGIGSAGVSGVLSGVISGVSAGASGVVGSAGTFVGSLSIPSILFR